MRVVVLGCNGAGSRFQCVTGYHGPGCIWLDVIFTPIGTISYAREYSIIYKCKYKVQEGTITQSNLRHSIGRFSNTKITISYKGISIRKVSSLQIKLNIIRIISTLQFGMEQLNHANLTQ